MGERIAKSGMDVDILGVKKSVASFVDITEREQVQKVLKETQEQLRTKLNHVQDVVFQLSPSSRIQYVSSSIKQGGL